MSPRAYLTAKQIDVLAQISNTLKANDIPYVVIGGLAAIAWGSGRSLVDIDIQVGRKDLVRTRDLFVDYLQKDIRHYQTEKWDIYQMVIELNGVGLDICQAEDFFVLKDGKKYLISDSIDSAVIKNVQNVVLPVLPLGELEYYKELVDRPVDTSDIEDLGGSPTNTVIINKE